LSRAFPCVRIARAVSAAAQCQPRTRERAARHNRPRIPRRRLERLSSAHLAHFNHQHLEQPPIGDETRLRDFQADDSGGVVGNRRWRQHFDGKLGTNTRPQLAHLNRRHFDGRPSLSGHCGHGPIFIAQRSVANDPIRTSTVQRSIRNHVDLCRG